MEQKNKADPFDVEEVVQEMPRDQKEALWGKLCLFLQDVLQKLPPECWEESNQARVEDGMDVESSADPVGPLVQP